MGGVLAWGLILKACVRRVRRSTTSEVRGRLTATLGLYLVDSLSEMALTVE